MLSPDSLRSLHKIRLLQGHCYLKDSHYDGKNMKTSTCLSVLHTYKCCQGWQVSNRSDTTDLYLSSPSSILISLNHIGMSEAMSQNCLQQGLVGAGMPHGPCRDAVLVQAWGMPQQPLLFGCPQLFDMLDDLCAPWIL